MYFDRVRYRRINNRRVVRRFVWIPMVRYQRIQLLYPFSCLIEKIVIEPDPTTGVGRQKDEKGWGNGSNGQEEQRKTENTGWRHRGTGSAERDGNMRDTLRSPTVRLIRSGLPWNVWGHAKAFRRFGPTLRPFHQRCFPVDEARTISLSSLRDTNFIFGELHRI